MFINYPLAEANGNDFFRTLSVQLYGCHNIHFSNQLIPFGNSESVEDAAKKYAEFLGLKDVVVK